jgi:transposase
MSDSVNQARAFEVLTATPIRTRRTPRDWPDAEKARLIAETMLPGVNVSPIARADGRDAFPSWAGGVAQGGWFPIISV